MVHSKGDKPVQCLQDIIASYVWERYLHFLGRPKRLFANKMKHTIDIEWDNLTFEHSSETFVQYSREEDVLESINFSAYSLNPNKNSESYVSADSDVGAPYVLCSRTFENLSRKRRQFKVCIHKETPVSVNIRFREYFTLNNDTNIRVDLPKNIVPGDKNQHSLLVTDAANQTFSNTCQWDVNHGVIVKGGHTVKASCVVYDQEKYSEVVVTTKLSSRNECFSVDVKQRSDQKVVYTCIITNLADVFRTHVGPNLKLVNTTDDFNKQLTNVILTSRGTCKASGFSDQHILVRFENVLEYTV